MGYDLYPGRLVSFSVNHLLCHQPGASRFSRAVLTDGDAMTLLALAGMDRLTKQRDAERRAYDVAVQKALNIFSQSVRGLPERELVEALVADGIDRSLASASADELVSGGAALKDWQTGFLKPRE